jgi:hypothetical protein
MTKQQLKQFSQLRHSLSKRWKLRGDPLEKGKSEKRPFTKGVGSWVGSSKMGGRHEHRPDRRADAAKITLKRCIANLDSLAFIIIIKTKFPFKNR